MRKKKNLVGAAESAETSETANSAIVDQAETANSAEVPVAETANSAEMPVAETAEAADTTGAAEAVGSLVSESAEVAEAVSPDDPAVSAKPVADLSNLTPHVKAASEMLFGAVNPF